LRKSYKNKSFKIMSLFSNQLPVKQLPPKQKTPSIAKAPGGFANTSTQVYSPEITLSETEDQPTDTISKISWGPGSSRFPTFATSNWDSRIRIYQVNVQGKTMSQKTSFSAGSASFCVNWHPEMTRVFAGCAPNMVKEFDIETGKGTEIGKHRSQVKDVYWVPSTQTLCSVSSDKTIKFWDVRQSSQVGEIKLEYQPYCADMFENKLILGLAKSKVLLLDVIDAQKTRDSNPQLNYMDCNLKCEEQYTSIKFMNDGLAMGLGCLDGRGNFSEFGNLDDLYENKLLHKITWKASRNPAGTQSPVKSVFACKRNPNFIGTCTEDGKVIFWDCQAKQRIKELNIGSRLACSAMSLDGNLLAFATGENWFRGEIDADEKKSQIFVHIMQEEELSSKKPK